MKCLVDGDALPFLAGFAVEKVSYAVVYETEQGELRHEQIGGGDILKQFKKTHEGRILDQQRFATAEPLSHALSIVKSKLDDIKRVSGSEDLEIYLSATSECFREKIATIAGYKANRDRAHKPIHFNAIRNYLVEHHGAHMVEGDLETDDIIKMRAYDVGTGYLICTIDKDLDQIPGPHYNYGKNVGYEVHPEDALRMFYTQILIGDPSDNIPGCWKVGEKKAGDIIDTVWALYDRADEVAANFEHALWEAVVNTFEKSHGVDGCPYAGMPSELVALEMARLVWLLEYRNQLWTPPGAPLEYRDVEVNLDD